MPTPCKATMPRKPATKNNAEPPKVGETIHALRQAKQLSLDELSRRSGVSKSMLSQIERNQANPTVAIVWRLATALDVPISDLLAVSRTAAPQITVVGAHAHPSLASSDGKCQLRILGPLDSAGAFEWYELSIQPGGKLESQPHEPGSREHLTVFSGAIGVTSAGVTEKLKAGETARYAADVPHTIANSVNTGKVAATALLVVIHP
jgi:XRE family transcriptional regulator, regulator of sulfur utilization